MRAVLHGDVVTLARVLLGVKKARRSQLCSLVFDQAHAADKYRKRFGRYHKSYGSGSLASACWGKAKVPEPFLSDKDYAHCLKVIFDQILQGWGANRVHK
jgi:hypothetical protein